MRSVHIAVVLVALALVGCGDATAGDSPAEASPPAHGVAIVIPEAEDGRVAAGTIVEVVYPGGATRLCGDHVIDREAFPRVEYLVQQGLPVREVPVKAALGDAELARERLDAHRLRPTDGQGRQPLLGSTALAQDLTPTAFSAVIDRFYRAASEVLIDAGALIEKLIGDEVTAIFPPGFAGPQYVRDAIDAGRCLLEAEAGHDDRSRPHHAAAP